MLLSVTKGKLTWFQWFKGNFKYFPDFKFKFQLSMQSKHIKYLNLIMDFGLLLACNPGLLPAGK